MRSSPEMEGLGGVIIVAFNKRTRRFRLVYDRSKPRPWFWKFCGGGVEEKDTDPTQPDNVYQTAMRAAIREAKEETDLTLEVQLLATRNTRRDTQYVFIGIHDSVVPTKMGVEGELVNDFSLEQIFGLMKNKVFLPSHVSILTMACEYIHKNAI